jgi:lipopolysaccharide/colanic/teichoic acid biosynthesis glycosyltransferase
MFGPPYPYFDRRARRTPVPGWQLRLHRSRLWRAIVGEVPPAKRIIDIAGSTAMLTVLAPLLIFIVAVIKVQGGGPVLLWQTRVGRRGRCFAFPKFRSIIHDADPRVTRFGRLIRKYSLDKMPQLVSVLAGDTSLVGPRPSPPHEVDRYTPRDLRRLEVAPGLTCWWQIEGRGDRPFEQQVDLDLRYVDNHSLLLDVMLLLRTSWAVLRG